MSIFKTFTDLSVLTAAELNTYLMGQTVTVFDDAAARDAAIPSAAVGRVVFLADSRTFWVRNQVSGTFYWVPMPGTTVFESATTAAQSLPGGGSDTNLNLGTPALDLTGAWGSGQPSRFTCQVPGRYKFDGGYGLLSHATNGTYRQANWFYNTTAFVASNQRVPPVSTSHTAVNARTLTANLGVGDYVRLVATHDAGGAVDTVSVRVTVQYVGL